MTRDQHLDFCKRCTNREFTPLQGVICSLTKKIADFDGTCENFIVDESVKIELPPAEPVPSYQVVGNLTSDIKEKLRVQQDFVYAIIGGLSASTVGAIIWALITVSTNYQIGYMAIAIGLLVGFSVRYFGAGIDYSYGIIGGFFALLGCALGNLLSQVAFIADAESLGYFDVLTLLSPSLIISIFEESFSGMDIVFYGIAAYEGYKIAFRNLSEELLKSVAQGKLQPLPYANYRLPIVIVLFVGLSTSIYVIHKGSVGTKTFLYKSGAKMSEGPMEYGVENGAWNYWWENGNQQQTGFFKDGKQDSIWQFYNEDGVLYRKGTFHENVQHGEWADFYPNGQVSGTGNYVMGRQQGSWNFFYEDGTINQKGSFKEDKPDGEWETYFPNGKLSAKGSFNKRELTGVWNYWNEDGTKSQELDYGNDEHVRILNSWDNHGKQLVKDGNGIHSMYFPSGEIMERGQVVNGGREGLWKIFTIDGKVKEDGDYRDGIYYLNNAWSPAGEALVVKGEGTYKSYYDDLITVQETGKISAGLRTGEWNVLSATDGNVIQKSNYKDGKLNGKQESYFEGGELSVEGNMIDNKREGEWKWYYQNGTVETTITYIKNWKQGDQPFYDEDGTLTRTEKYSNNELIDVTVDNL